MFGTAQVKPSPRSSSTAANHIAAPPRRRHAANAHKVHRRRDHAATLMRTAVTKPHSHHPSPAAGRLEPDSTDPGQNDAFTSINAQPAVARRQRAQKTSKSGSISRFSYSADIPVVVKKTAHLAVQDSPSQSITVHHITEAAPALSTPVGDLFESALTKATSHQQPAPKTKHRRSKTAKKLGLSRRATNIGATALIVLALGGFIAYQNLASISMHMAVAKAGVHATLPGYRPAGFALSHNFQTAPGQVVISFKSHSDDRNFKLSQSTSDWNSQTLLDNYVATTDEHYQQISQGNGQTVFLYGDANATWVNGGVWYKIEGNSSLSSDQLLKIANSF